MCLSVMCVFYYVILKQHSNLSDIRNGRAASPSHRTKHPITGSFVLSHVCIGITANSENATSK